MLMMLLFLLPVLVFASFTEYKEELLEPECWCTDQLLLFCVMCSPGCSPVLDGSSNAQNGLEGDDDHEEYTLMSIDTIINGKVL